MAARLVERLRMGRPVEQVAGKRHHDVGPASADAEIEHRPMVAVPKHLRVGGELFVETLGPDADDRVAGMAFPV